MSRSRLLAGVCVVLGVALTAAFVFIAVNQQQLDVQQTRTSSAQRQIAVLQEQLGEAFRQLAAGQADRIRLQRLVRALQQQVRALGGTPLAQPQSPEGTERTAPATSTPTPTARRSPTPRPSPTRTPAPSPRPSPDPSPSPTRICPLPGIRICT